MIVPEFALVCEQCLEPFWHEGFCDFDLSLYSTADVRALAKAAGWAWSRDADTCRLCLEHAAAGKGIKKVVVIHG